MDENRVPLADSQRTKSRSDGVDPLIDLTPRQVLGALRKTDPVGEPGGGVGKDLPQVQNASATRGHCVVREISRDAGSRGGRWLPPVGQRSPIGGILLAARRNAVEVDIRHIREWNGHGRDHARPFHGVGAQGDLPHSARAAPAGRYSARRRSSSSHRDCARRTDSRSRYARRRRRSRSYGSADCDAWTTAPARAGRTPSRRARIGPADELACSDDGIGVKRREKELPIEAIHAPAEAGQAIENVLAVEQMLEPGEPSGSIICDAALSILACPAPVLTPLVAISKL